MYEISRETFDLRPGDGVDQVCQLLIGLAEEGRPMERITVFSDRVEVHWIVDENDEVVRLTEGRPSSIESMLGTTEMLELPQQDDCEDLLRTTFMMCREMEKLRAKPISWVVGDLDMVVEGLKPWGKPAVESVTPMALFGLPVVASAQLGVDRIVLVGGASRHHNPERGTHAVTAVMKWVGAGQ
jgi:hypothetical protein